MMQVVMQVESNVSDAQQLEQMLQLRASEFFECPPDQVVVTRPSRRSIATPVLTQMEAVLSGDPSEYADTSGLLEEYLGSANLKTKVLTMVTTCGSGYTPTQADPAGAANGSSDAEACSPCQAATFKTLLDNSPCEDCPTHSSTNATGAVAESQCACNYGFTRANESELQTVSLKQGFQCVSSAQYISAQAAAEVAGSVSTAVGIVVAANVAVAVGTSVGVSVSSAVAASSGGAVGGVLGGAGAGGSGGAAGGSSVGSSSGSSTLTLITQVQFLNQVGRIGGSSGSESLASFSGISAHTHTSSTGPPTTDTATALCLSPDLALCAQSSLSLYLEVALSGTAHTASSCWRSMKPCSLCVSRCHTGGFAWANFDLGLSILPAKEDSQQTAATNTTSAARSRRSAKAAAGNKANSADMERPPKADSAGNEETGDASTCSLEDIAPTLERIITCGESGIAQDACSLEGRYAS